MIIRSRRTTGALNVTVGICVTWIVCSVDFRDLEGAEELKLVPQTKQRLSCLFARVPHVGQIIKELSDLLLILAGIIPASEIFNV